MGKRIAIYGGTELSAAESWFVMSLTHALLTNADVTIVTGGFLYWPQKRPGAISTDFSVMQGAIRYAHEQGIGLHDCLETWLPDPQVENDPQKKDVVRFKEGVVKELAGESAQARRFSMVRDVDALITIKGKKHTSLVLDFAVTINKPALPLPFTNGDSRVFWNMHKDRIKKWFDIADDFAHELETKEPEEWPPAVKKGITEKIVAAVSKAIKKELLNEEYYKKLQKELEMDVDADPNRNIESTAGNGKRRTDKRAVEKQLKMFLSYSRKDAILKDELDKHLTALKRSQKISIWQDKNIEGGSEWDEVIKKELSDADIILLLISPDFVASDYIWNIELDYALRKHKARTAKVIPVFLRSIDTKGMPFEGLQGYMSADKPIAYFRGNKRDNAFREVVKGISNDINKWMIQHLTG